MQNYRLEFFLEVLPPPLNIFMRMNFKKRKNHFDEIYSAVYFATLRKKPKSPLKKCHITLVRFGTKLLDYDGLVGSFKPVVDGLIHSAVIIDDGYNVTGKWNVDQQIVKKSKTGISIIVEGVHEE